MAEENTNQPAEEPQEQPAAEESKQEEQAVQEISNDSKNMAMLCHLLAIFTSFIAPLIIWLIKKETDPFVDRHGKEALNFQIFIVIAFAISTIIVCLAPFLYPIIAVFNTIFCIIASIKASKGEEYRYPLPFRFLK